MRKVRDGIDLTVRLLILLVVLAAVLAARVLNGPVRWIALAGVMGFGFVVLVPWAQQRAKNRQSSDRSAT